MRQHRGSFSYSFSSIFIVRICSGVMPFLFPYSVQYFVDALTKSPEEIGIVTRKILYFWEVIEFASCFIFLMAKILKGVVRMASPLPIFKTEPKGHWVF